MSKMFPTTFLKTAKLFRSNLLNRRLFSIRQFDDRPGLDFDFLLNPSNLESIRRNIKNRKQVGDIDRVHRLWAKLNSILIDRQPIDRKPIDDRSTSTSLKPLELKSLWDEFYDACFAVPNRSHPDSPLGDESSKRLIEEVGRKSPSIDCQFRPQTAESIALMLRAIRASSTDVCTMAGDKAYFLYDNLALLEKALIDFALSIVQRKYDFELIRVPDVLNVDVPRKCGLTSRTEKNIVYMVKNSNSAYCLSGTGEMGLASYLENRTFDENETLPKRYVTISRCFRPEVAFGKIARGIYRVHEFTKVEMFAVTVDRVEESEKMLQEFVRIQKEIYDGLQLHYRLLDMPTRELGASAYRKFDIEAWMPGRDIYGEISSASNCTDYQSRRLGTKYKTKSGETRFVHTVNGTACAASRLLIAVMEQHQQQNKLVHIPDALKPFFNNWPALYPSRVQLKAQTISPRIFRDDETQNDAN